MHANARLTPEGRRILVERIAAGRHRTMTDEWAYVQVYRSEAERIAALADWLHTYNHHRNHTAIGGPPITRVHNLSEQHT